MRFLRTWIGLLWKGDSYLGRGVRAAALVVALGAPLALQDKLRLTLELPSGAGLSFEPSFGGALASLLAVAYVLVTVGMAVPLSRGPKLVVDAVPEADARYSMFRLRVRNEGAGVAEPQVNVLNVLLADGSSPVARPAFPFELRWSHLKKTERPKLVKRSGGATADVAFVSWGISEKKHGLTFQFGGMSFSPEFFTQQTVYVHLVVVMDGHPPIDRWLAFDPDRSAALQCRVSGKKPPSTIAAKSMAHVHRRS